VLDETMTPGDGLGDSGHYETRLANPYETIANLKIAHGMVNLDVEMSSHNANIRTASQCTACRTIRGE